MRGKFWSFNVVQTFGVLVRISDRPVMVENKCRSIFHVLSCALSPWTICSQNRVSGKAGELSWAPVSAPSWCTCHTRTLCWQLGWNTELLSPRKRRIKTLLFCCAIWEKVWSFCFDVTLVTSEAGQCMGMDGANPSVSNVFSLSRNINQVYDSLCMPDTN